MEVTTLRVGANNYVLAVVFAFIEEATAAGRAGMWTAEQVRTAVEAKIAAFWAKHLRHKECPDPGWRRWPLELIRNDARHAAYLG